MTHSELKVEKRIVTGNSVRKLRNQSILPMVLYSHSVEPINIQVNIGEFIKLYKVAGKNHVVDLVIEKKVYAAIVHDLDINPVTQQVRHVDFLAVNLNEKVSASVPVILLGEARGVKENALVMIQNTDQLQVLALPDNIPNAIEVDIQNLLSISDNITVADLEKNQNYEIEENPETVIVSLVAQSSEVEEIVSEVVVGNTPA